MPCRRLVSMLVLIVLLFAAHHTTEAVRAGAKEPRFVVVAGRPSKGEPPIGGELQEPFGVEADSRGNLFVIELGGGRVHRLAADGRFATIAGDGSKGAAGD